VIALRQRLRLRREDGFTLVELLIAMIVLTIGILALVSAYTSGYVQLNRATRVSSAEVLADSQMERFRALGYSAIQLNTTCGATCNVDSTYTGDVVYDSTDQVSGCSSSTETTCLAIQTKTGPDGRSYRMETFIKYNCPTSGTTLSISPLKCTNNSDSSTAASPVKTVTVVVTAAAASTGLGITTPVSVREQSAFTSLLGQ
jgi:prepilin-type N-terminal cleavage/methylation domain-containing protein